MSQIDLIKLEARNMNESRAIVYLSFQVLENNSVLSEQNAIAQITAHTHHKHVKRLRLHHAQ